jgi:ABC-2 type transport system permease protein
MSGLFTPIENMPDWAQLITLFNPVRYFIEVTRMVMLKGAGYAEIQWHLLVMIFYTIGINSLAVLKYKKTV